MSFQFRLTKVLDWYEEKRKAEEDRLRVLTERVESLRQAVLSLCAARKAEADALQAAASISPSDLIALAAFQKSSAAQERQFQADEERCAREMAAQNIVVQAARRRVRLLEKLRERRLGEYSLAMERELEQLAADSYQAASRSRQAEPSD